MDRYHVRVERSVYARCRTLWIFKDEGGQCSLVRPVECQPIEPYSVIDNAEPTVRLDDNAAQELMDDLWASGVRPTEGAGTAGSMAAAQKHLDDMREIAFGLLRPWPKSEEEH